MKKNAKKIVVVIALIALMAIPSMMAYFTDQAGLVENVFTTGDVEITLEDTISDSTEDVVPNQAITGTARVKNTGANPAYVFVEVDASTDYLDIVYNTDWNKIDVEDRTVYGYNKAVVKEESVSVFDSIRVKKSLVSEANENMELGEINVKAYAVQAEWITDDNTTATLDQAWAAFNNPTGAAQN